MNGHKDKGGWEEKYILEVLCFSLLNTSDEECKRLADYIWSHLEPCKRQGLQREQ